MAKFNIPTNFEEEKKYYSFVQKASIITDFSNYLKEQTRKSLHQELFKELFKGEEDLHIIVRKCREDLDLNPRDYVANTQLGKAYLQKEKANIAIRQFKRSLEVLPDYREALYYLMITYYLYDKLDLARDISNSFKEPPDLIRLCINGDIHYINEEIEDALENFNKALWLDKQNIVPYIGLGLVYNLAGNLEQAIEFNKKALKIDNNNIFASINLAFNLFLCGELEYSLDISKKMLTCNPQSPLSNFACAFFLFEYGNYDESIEYYHKALEAEPSNYICYNALGFLYYTRNELNLAITNYLKSIELNPDYPDGHMNLAFSYQLTGELDKALKKYREVILLDNKNILSYYNMAAIFRSTGELSETIECYQKTISLDPHSPYAYGGLGLTYIDKWLDSQKADKNSLILAQENINMALKIDPSLINGRLGLGILFQERDNLPEASRHFETLLKIAPEYLLARVKLYEVYLDLANKYFAQGKFELAVRTCEKAYELNPDENKEINGIQLKGAKENLIFFCKHIGEDFYKKGQVSNALEYYKKLLNLNPSDALLNHKLGIIYDLRKEFDNSEYFYKNAIKINPDFEIPYYNLGIIYKNKGDYPDAGKCFQKYLILSPDGHHSQECLEYLKKMQPELHEEIQEKGKIQEEIERSRILEEEKSDRENINLMAWDHIADEYQTLNRISIQDVHYGPLFSGEKDLGLLGYIDGKTVLELGCGGGQNSIALAHKGAIVTAIDFSIEQLRFAEKLRNTSGVSVTFINGNIENLSFLKNQKFDIIFSCFTLSYVENISGVFSEVRKHINDDGIFVFSLEHPFMANVWNENYIKFQNKIYPFMKNYFNTGKEEIIWQSEMNNVRFSLHKRKLEDIINPLILNGFKIELMLEPSSEDAQNMTPEELSNIPYLPSIDQISYDLTKILPHTLIIKAAPIIK